jgi:hypothetical protein
LAAGFRALFEAYAYCARLLFWLLMFSSGSEAGSELPEAERRQFGSGDIDGDLDVAAALLERAGAAALRQFPVLVGYAREDQGRLVRRPVGAQARRFDAGLSPEYAKSILEQVLPKRTISREPFRPDDV